MTGVETLIAVVLVAWLASGLAAVSLAPRNPAARWLLAAGALLGASAVTEEIARTSDSAVGFALTRTAYWICFLGAVAAIAGTLARLPDGVLDRRWHGAVTRGLAVAAVAVPLLELLAAPRLAVADDTVARANPLALGGLEPLGTAAGVVRGTEPAWVLLGVALLVLRHRRGDAARRRELTWALRGIGLLAAMLALVVALEVSGFDGAPEGISVPGFLVALALFPGTLLWSITRRVRTLEQRLVESRTRLVEAEDEARRRLERDLHDGVQQQLVGALLLVAVADRQLERGAPVARATVGEVGDRLRETMTELRELLHGIRPPVLEHAGLLPALDSRLARLPVPVELHADDRAAGRWPAAVESAAYFVVTEAVTNALKHAPGARVTVRLAGADSVLRAEVSDDGPGVDGAVLDGAPRGGLRGLRDRVESLRGTFEVCGTPGRGTVVRADFPAEVAG